MSYNLTVLKEATDLVGIVSFANDVTSQLFVGFIILSLYIIMIMVLKRYDFVQAILSSSFVMFLLSILLTYAGLLNLVFPLLFLFITGMVALYLYTSG